MGKRKSTGKRLRFEVFKRDHFTCQYCGAQPPDVVLVADHITPVAQGGGNEMENLITACETCNQGKADKVLADRAIRPDADLMYLETQQEIAELKRFQAAKAARDAALASVADQLEATWVGYVNGANDWHPARAITLTLMERYGPEITEEAYTDVASKIGTGYISTYGDKWLRYLYAVARNLHAAQYQEEA